MDVFVSGTLVKTTQTVYGSGVYAPKGQNPTTNASDNVFADGTQYELAALAGDITAGYTATLNVGIAL